MTSSGISPLTRARMPRSDPSLFDAPPDRGRSLYCFGPCWVQCVEVSRDASCPCCSGHDGGSRLRRTVIIRSWLSLRRCPGRRPGCWAGVRAEGRRRSWLRGDVDGVDRTGPLRGVRPDRRERCCSFDGLDGAGCRSVRGCRSVAILLSVAALVGSAVAILFGYLRPGLVYVTAGMVVGAQLAFAWATPESSGLPGTWWAWQLMIPVCVLIFAAQPLPAAVRRVRWPWRRTRSPAVPGQRAGARDPCHGLGPVLLLSLRGGRARDGTGVAPDGRGVRRDESRAARRGLCPAGCGCGSSTTAADSTPTGSANADFHAGGSPQRSAEFVADGLVAEPGYAGVGG